MAQDDTIFAGVMPVDPHFEALALDEEVLAPEVPLIDAHMHLWTLWPDSPYLIPQFEADIARSGHDVRKSVFVECHTHYDAQAAAHLRPVGESRFVLSHVKAHAPQVEIAAGIVAFADLLDEANLPAVLDAHAIACEGRLRGIRQRAKWDRDPAVTGSWGAKSEGIYLQPAFQRSVALLGERGLSFDASVYHPQLPDVAALARACPQTQILLNHTGSPVGHNSYRGREAENLAQFSHDMQRLSDCPNVAVKLGGMLMNLANFDFRFAPHPLTSMQLLSLWRPHLQICLDHFGAARCMASSNFPVDKAGFSYRSLWNMFKRLLEDASGGERDAVLYGTAQRLYRL